MPRLEIHRQCDHGRIRREQPGGQQSRSNVSRHLSNADVERKVRMLPLRHAHCIVQCRGQVQAPAGISRFRFSAVCGCCVNPAEGTNTVFNGPGSGMPNPPNNRPANRVLCPPMPKMVALVAFQPRFTRNGTGG